VVTGQTTGAGARPEHVRPVRLSGESLPDFLWMQSLGTGPRRDGNGGLSPFSRCSADGHSAVRQKKLHESRHGITSRMARLSRKSATVRVARRLLEERNGSARGGGCHLSSKTRAHLLPLSPADSLHDGPEPMQSVGPPSSGVSRLEEQPTGTTAEVFTTHVVLRSLVGNRGIGAAASHVLQRHAFKMSLNRSSPRRAEPATRSCSPA
jgi:hypothetical protein